jgi:hypothetical protein
MMPARKALVISSHDERSACELVSHCNSIRKRTNTRTRSSAWMQACRQGLVATQALGSYVSRPLAHWRTYS